MPEAEPMTAVTKHVYVKNSDGNQAVGQTKSIINDDKEHAVSIHYPIMNLISKETLFPLFFIQKRIFPLWHILLNVLIRWYLK